MRSVEENISAEQENGHSVPVRGSWNNGQRGSKGSGDFDVMKSSGSVEVDQELMHKIRKVAESQNRSLVDLFLSSVLLFVTFQRVKHECPGADAWSDGRKGATGGAAAKV
jgi:hypothetical protein